MAIIVAGAVFACGSEQPEVSSGADDGASLYGANCASCHGADLRGTDEGPSQLSIVYEPNHHNDESYRSAIRNGAQQHHWSFGDMDPVNGLSDAEVDAIIGFVRDTQASEGFESYPP
jgi:mono/diheme cytochrome c family protein